jgi:hypothetical protein
MDNNSINNWELHQKLMEKKYGKTPITDKYNFENNSELEKESYLRDRKKYYVSNTLTIHTDTPVGKNNEVTLLCEHFWVIKSISEYIIQEENRVGVYKNLLSDLIGK